MLLTFSEDELSHSRRQRSAKLICWKVEAHESIGIHKVEVDLIIDFSSAAAQLCPTTCRRIAGALCLHLGHCRLMPRCLPRLGHRAVRGNSCCVVMYFINRSLRRCSSICPAILVFRGFGPQRPHFVWTLVVCLAAATATASIIGMRVAFGL
jgi:hypothetical protein